MRFDPRWVIALLIFTALFYAWLVIIVETWR